jgi:hypothetical protein
MEEDVLYTDGHNIRVTPQQLIVGQTEYLLRGITNLRVQTIRANMAPPIILIILGIGSAVMGFMHMFREQSAIDIESVNKIMGPNEIAMIIGGILFILGVIWALAAHEKYAVRVTTAEGEKNVVVSTKKDYVNQIVSAINRALGIRVQNNTIS